jgi:diaminopimelate decarboxylase
MAFDYRDNDLYCDGVPLQNIAKRAGTPCYVYSADTILQRYREYDEALGDVDHEVCYAVKANSNVSVLRLLSQAGAGFDIVSGGELYRVLKAGGDPDSIVFSGVGKTAEDIEYALAQKIHTFNCESEPEVDLVDALAGRAGVKARIAIRVNPDVDAATHPYISTGLSEHKFGVDIHEVEHVYSRALNHQNIVLEGVSCHIGSQILNTAPLLESVDKMLDLVDRLRANGVPIRHLDLGGGLGVAYKPTDQAPDMARLASCIREKVRGRGVKIMIEPGRSIVGDAGVLLTRVLYRKQTPRKEFVVVDAAMNDLIRPALYQSHHEIIPLRKAQPGEGTLADVVGPVCETGDFLARGRKLPNVFPGDVLAVMTSGAYGFVQSSNYNSRPRVAEVMVEGTEWRVIRHREKFEDLVRGE